MDSTLFVDDSDSAYYLRDFESGSVTDSSGAVTTFFSQSPEEQTGQEMWGHNSKSRKTSDSSSTYRTTSGPVVTTRKHDSITMDDQDSSSAYVRNVGSNAVGSSSGTYSYDKVYNGSEVVTGTMYGNFASYYGWVEDLSGNLEDFTNFGGGEQLRYLAPLIPTPGEVAPASFATPPQKLTFTAPPSSGLQPPGPVEGGEEEPSTLGTVWYYAWEYGGEFVPLVGSGRGFKRAYDEGSTLGMAWNGLIFGVEATGVGAALGLIGKGGKAAVATSKVAASGLRPMVSGMASAAKAKAVEAVSAAKSTVSDAVGAVGNKLDGLGERLAGLFWGGAKKVDDANEVIKSLPKPKASSIVRNELQKHELEFVEEIASFRGGRWVGQTENNMPGIDGWLNGNPMSLKILSGKSPTRLTSNVVLVVFPTKSRH